MRINYSKIEAETQSNKIRIKSLVAWSIFEGRLDQKHADINFVTVWPNTVKCNSDCSILIACVHS